jgi:putative ABC transport system substrate-binding protein
VVLDRASILRRKMRPPHAISIGNDILHAVSSAPNEVIDMKRREFIALVGGSAVAWPFAASAQQATKLYQIGFLSGVAGRGPATEAFVQGLRDLGYIEGQNITIEWRFAAGRMEVLPEMAADLARRQVDTIVAVSNVAGVSAKSAATTIPIVVLASHDGVGTGLFASLSRPGGNITGVEALAPEIDAKRVEILKSILPQFSRLTVLYNPTVPGSATHLDYVNRATKMVGTAVATAEVRSHSDFDRAFTAILQTRPDAIVVVTDPLVFTERKRIVDFGTQHAIPAMYEFREFVELGGLVSYGPSLTDMVRRGALYVDKILKGAKPAELPVEQPTRFQLVINLKAAKTLGLTVPSMLLARADEVIE